MTDALLLPQPPDAPMTRDGIDRTQAVPGMAHFAGTGPRGETCGRCRFRAALDGRCRKYRELMQMRGKPVSTGNAACKYFERSVHADARTYDFGGGQ